MIEKNKESQTQSLAELQQELKSLKTLLLSRGPGVPSSPAAPLPSFTGRPSIPAWQLAGNNQNVSSGTWEPTPASGVAELNGKGKEVETSDSN